MLVEFLGHLFGEADAPVGSGVAGDVSGVHPDGAVDAHEIPHGGPEEAGAGGFGVCFDTDVAHDDVSGGVDVIAVEIGAVVFVFLRDFEISGGGAVTFATGGDL